MNREARAVLAAVACLLLGAIAFREAGLAWLALPFLSYFGIALALSPAREGLRLEARRECRAELAGAAGRGAAGAGNPGPAGRIEVIARVRNLGEGRISVLLEDPLPPGARLVGGSLSARASLGPGEEAELRYLLESERGAFEWSRVVARVGDPFGLFEAELRPEARAEARVRPSYRRWRPFALRLDRTLSSPGSIPIRLGGSGTEFWGIREYRPGDPLRRLYWRLNARDPFRRYIKESIQERTAEIVIVLDGRERMEVSAGGASLFEREVAAVASLAAMLIRQGHRVGLFITGARARDLVPDYGRVQLRRILDRLAEARPESERARESLRHLPALRYSPSAFMIAVSPFEADDAASFQRLRALGYRGMLVSPDTLRFARPETAADPLGSLAATLCRVEREIGLRRIAGLSFPVLDWDAEEDLAGPLEAALSRLSPARRAAGGAP
jgi:uncharacterized protein (DUF58 family)